MKIKSIITLISLFLSLTYASCDSNPADMKLGEMEIIILKWEKEFQNKPVGFNEMVLIQKDITIYDVDPRIFAATYGNLTIAQTEKINDLRNRFKKLIRKAA